MSENGSNKKIWLSIPNCCHVNEIKISLGSALTKSMYGQIWFEDTPSGRQAAEELLKEIKKTIFRMCQDDENYKWLTEAWVNAPIKWN